ncbi:MAG: CBS domain-containing protein [Epulopiscium sp.]|nr:CBS domain-containing protein [Candidatus Epulonipiscium sp.]
MKVKDVMTQDVYTVQANDPIWKAAQVMRDANVGAVPVQDRNEMVGIITDRDIAIRDVASQQSSQTCKDIMSTGVISCDANTDIDEVSDLMAEHQVRRLPVMENGEIVGMVALADLATDERFQDEAQEALEDISTPNPSDLS